MSDSTTPDDVQQQDADNISIHEDVPTEVIKEVNNEPKVGEYVGQCKWFNDNLGFGFLTIQTGLNKGKDIFVHHSGIKPLNSNYKTLKKGEYVNFDIIEGDNGQQAYNVTGIGGGSLICDVTPYHKPVYQQQQYQKNIVAAPPPPPRQPNTYRQQPRGPPPTQTYRVQNRPIGFKQPLDNRRGYVGMATAYQGSHPAPKWNGRPVKVHTMQMQH